MREILASWPGIEPAPAAVEVQSLNHWATNYVQCLFFLINSSLLSIYYMQRIGSGMAVINKKNSLPLGFHIHPYSAQFCGLPL